MDDQYNNKKSSSSSKRSSSTSKKRRQEADQAAADKGHAQNSKRGKPNDDGRPDTNADPLTNAQHDMSQETQTAAQNIQRVNVDLQQQAVGQQAQQFVEQQAPQTSEHVQQAGAQHAQHSRHAQQQQQQHHNELNSIACRDMYKKCEEMLQHANNVGCPSDKVMLRLSTSNRADRPQFWNTTKYIQGSRLKEDFGQGLVPKGGSLPTRIRVCAMHEDDYVVPDGYSSEVVLYDARLTDWTEAEAHFSRRPGVASLAPQHTQHRQPQTTHAQQLPSQQPMPQQLPPQQLPPQQPTPQPQQAMPYPQVQVEPFRWNNTPRDYDDADALYAGVEETDISNIGLYSR